MTDNQNQGFWRCQGKEGSQHPELHLTPEEDACPQCGKKRPRVISSIPTSPPTNPASDASNIPPSTSITAEGKPPQPQKNRQLFGGLIVLNLISLFTTMEGATQVLPKVAAYPAGATIQFLLFLLLSSRQNREHLPKFVRWSVIGGLSFLSIYTSFFAYYELMTAGDKKSQVYDRSVSAHQSLVSDVFTPIQEKIEKLESGIKTKENEIAAEKEARRPSGQLGCGSECKKLIKEKEILQAAFNKDKPLLDRLKPLFEYEPSKITAEKVFDLDRKALGSVTTNCLSSNPTFICLPNEYRNVLNPQSPKYEDFKNKYFDPDLKIGLIAPFLKIKQGEPPAIGAATIALIIDGCIILLGLGIEGGKPRKKIPLSIKGKGSDFLNTFSKSINHNSLTIDLKVFEGTGNEIEYSHLLQILYSEKQWGFKEDEKEWQINENAFAKLIAWISEERSELLKKENSLIKIPQTGQSDKTMIYLRIPE
jgi:hypothetical protein